MQFEQERGYVASAVECYMKQHGVSEQVVHDELNRQVDDAWKDINEECMRPTVVPMPLLMCVLNLARLIDVIYKYNDVFNILHMKCYFCVNSCCVIEHQ